MFAVREFEVIRAEYEMSNDPTKWNESDTVKIY